MGQLTSIHKGFTDQQTLDGRVMMKLGSMRQGKGVVVEKRVVW